MRAAPSRAIRYPLRGQRHREELELHQDALSRLRQLAEGPDPWALPVFCAGEDRFSGIEPVGLG